MYTFLVVLLILDSFVLVLAVLMQAGKGSGLSASFGGAGTSPDSFVGTRQLGNLLTKSSWWTGGIFLFLALMLQVMSSRASTPRSVLDQTLSQPPARTAPATGAPAVPLSPVETPTTSPAKTPPNATQKGAPTKPAEKSAPTPAPKP
jgi:preprotein translocase subunit SecG